VPEHCYNVQLMRRKMPRLSMLLRKLRGNSRRGGNQCIIGFSFFFKKKKKFYQIDFFFNFIIFQFFHTFSSFFLGHSS